MKKIIALLLVICTCLSFSACFSKTESTQTEPTTKTIELNKDNIAEYLNMKMSVAESNYSRYARATVEFYPLQGGDFSNVEIVITTGISYSSEFDTGSERRYYIDRVEGAEIGGDIDYGGYLFDTTLKFKLPADGRYSVEFDIYWSDVDSLEMKYLKANGSFTPR